MTRTWFEVFEETDNHSFGLILTNETFRSSRDYPAVLVSIPQLPSRDTSQAPWIETLHYSQAFNDDGTVSTVMVVSNRRNKTMRSPRRRQIKCRYECRLNVRKLDRNSDAELLATLRQQRQLGANVLAAAGHPVADILASWAWAESAFSPYHIVPAEKLGFYQKWCIG
jgi:hypothetical protein